MSFSIGTSSPGMGPGRMLRTFGKDSADEKVDRRVIGRLLLFLRPHWQRMLVAYLLM
jgi:hypothetical protein